MDVITALNVITQELKKQNDKIDKLTEAVARLEAISGNHSTTKNRFVPVFCDTGPTFTDISENLKTYMQVSLDDVMFAKTNGYIKGIATILAAVFAKLGDDVSPFKVIDKKKKKFYIKLKECWCTNQTFNVEAFDKLVANVCLHFLNSVYQLQLEQPESLDTGMTTKIINSLMAQQKKTNFTKAVRNKVINQ